MKRVVSIAKVLWPAAFVFIAFDLSVDPDVSILRSMTNQDAGISENLQIVSLDDMHDGLPAVDITGESAGSEHLWFGVEETVETLSSVDTGSLADLDGGWSGQFASMLEGDVGENCWSAYEVNIRLSESAGKLEGPGSYVADPAGCSNHSEPTVAFFNATGERVGNQVSLVIVDDSGDETTMLFNGIVTGNNIVGNFSMASGAPASGTVVMKLADPQS